MPRALDRDGEGALTLRGKAGLATRLNLAALREEPAQAGDIFVVNLIHTIGGKDVHAAAAPAAATEPAAATAAESATAATTPAAEPATTATVSTTVIGTGGTGITRRTVVRCPLRALLISHGLFLLKRIRYRSLVPRA